MQLLHLFIVIVGLVAFAGIVLVIYEITHKSGLYIGTDEQAPLARENDP